MPPPQLLRALVGVSVGEAAARMSEKSQDRQVEPSPGHSIPLGPPKPPCTEGEQALRFGVLPVELPSPVAAPSLGAVLQRRVFWGHFNPSHSCMFPAGKEEEEEKG